MREGAIEGVFLVVIMVFWDYVVEGLLALRGVMKLIVADMRLPSPFSSG